MARIKAEITRTDNSVFVSIQPPEKFQQAMAAKAQPRVWAKVASQICIETPTTVPTPVPVPIADAKEIRIYAVDSVTGHRQRLFTGQPSDDTDNLCQSYANLADCRVESHDAASATVYHPEIHPIPTLADWVEVVNSDTNELIFVGLREDGFDARCRKYADAKGVGLRVDSAHQPVSRFYTPRADALKYARENAKHFAEKHGLAVGDAVGTITITVVAWAAYLFGGVA